MKPTAQDEITAYVFAVRAALGDLPEAQRDELLEDLTAHLTEVMADGEGSLTERLGSPEAYAAELRGAAPFVGGFPDPPSGGRVRVLAGLRNQVAPALSEHILPPLRSADARFGKFVGYERVSDFLRLLRPGWWVLRGYLLAMVVAMMVDNSGQPMGLLPRIGGSALVALLLLGGAVLGSIWFGRRGLELRRWSRLSLYAGTAVLALVALVGFFDVDSTTRGSYFQDVNNYTDPYGNVEDVFVYDEQGRLVTNARLFDQNGQPIHLGHPYCWVDEKEDADGYSSGYNEEREAGVYPFCPTAAPFRMPGASPTPGSSESPKPEAPGSSEKAKPESPKPSAEPEAPAKPAAPSPSAGR
ncbi:HAAS signaling domain-containing protein [Actinoplanes sp. NPDC051859]|uniref:HAAS signaling domain-containing protein n=1 Tax=Actinoplanes sp. NPDC051859 TaxID=3363909 RepID=UPI0037932A9E